MFLTVGADVVLLTVGRSECQAEQGDMDPIRAMSVMRRPARSLGLRRCIVLTEKGQMISISLS